jgi:3-deoxy-D-manno-octulosonic-acid transferase
MWRGPVGLGANLTLTMRKYNQKRTNFENLSNAMKLIYNLGIYLYYLMILAASPFNRKAALWIRGRKGLMRKIAGTIDPETALTWFHCSSLGEFEQGRPVMEELKRRDPARKILLTFYSPSGYEIRKNWEGADYVFYLPLDTRRNARRFHRLLNIEQAFFVKYEFWYHFLSGLYRRDIPVYLVSGIFRKNQVFFRWYGKWYRNILKGFSQLFVQQESSAMLLRSSGIDRVSVTGDTRFDRVNQIVRNIRPDDRFLKFCGENRIIVAGSTWPDDEEILTRFIHHSGESQKWIIAPHEIRESGIVRLSQSLTTKVQRYTRLEETSLEETRVLIIDTVGLLSSLYQYADITYIGGGFGKGIHNTLEAATFGKPVVFGPNYRKFQEAKDLVERQAAFPVSDFESLNSVLSRLLQDKSLLKSSGESSAEYVKSMQGASSRIVDFALEDKT